jgi:hypothetical protein
MIVASRNNKMRRLVRSVFSSHCSRAFHRAKLVDYAAGIYAILQGNRNQPTYRLGTPSQRDPPFIVV